MPFTFSHPAVVLPLYYLPKKLRSVTGLVIGSIVPDFEKFFRMSIHDGFSHTWPAIFYFNLPLAVLLSFAFHQIVRDPFIDNLPLFLKRKLLFFKTFDWLSYFKKHYLLVIASILMGVLSHLTWDSFTHPGGKLAMRLPFLSEWIEVFNHYMLLSTFFDRVSSVLGEIIIIGVVLSLPTQKMSRGLNNKKKSFWFITVLLTLLIITLRWWVGIEPQYFIWDLLVSMISASLLGLLITAYGIKVFSSTSKIW
ncbi:DUF4184 domain-containing protein [Adhaeribacter arboris]|uniref:DUF4184 domain-containing protein n=1 Tax=Adhaeribacter arboris TaxID=2072846 RepID=A0A2T2YL84_9BACT|nr:DUF4184 family protein [Adhaeribacter arboris]PSR56267.1 DUF4184 domain-containing protein [Adhaeribacter arboris]